MVVPSLLKIEETSLFNQFLNKLQTTQEKITQELTTLGTTLSQEKQTQFVEDLERMLQASRKAERAIISAFDLDVEGKAVEEDWKRIRHDLRATNGAILGYAELVQEDLAELGHSHENKLLEKLKVIAELTQDQFPFIDKLKLEDASLYITPHGGLYEDSAEENVEGEELPLGKILVVDDDEHKRNILFRRLKKNGYKVFLAENGTKAFSLLEKESFDLILLDIIMPGISGTEVLKQIKASEKHKYAPVLVISSLNDVESVIECINLGAEDYLPMPFNPVLLMARVRSCLDKKHLRDAELKKQKELNQLHAQLEAALESMEEGFAVFNLFDEMIICNNKFQELYPPTKTLFPKDYGYRTFLEANYKAGIYQIDRRRKDDHPESFEDWIEIRMSRHQFAQEPYMEQLSDGRWIEITEKRTPDGGTVSIHKDVTTLKEGQDKLKFLAHHDPLTKLSNRALFDQYLQMIYEKNSKLNKNFALIYLDLDGFKKVNDNFGHDFGDYLLIYVAQQISRAVRKEDLVARLGGDEFAIIVDNVEGIKQAKEMAERILESIGHQVENKGRSVNFGVSLGISLYPIDGTNLEDLLKKADQAMYEAKKSGEGIYYFKANCG